MQIVMRASSAAIGVENEDITTGKCQILPSWAPPIAYLPDHTTGPWLAFMMKDTTSSASNHTKIHAIHVYAFGRRPTLYSGRECVTLSEAVVTNTTTHRHILTLTYRALGEIARP